MRQAGSVLRGRALSAGRAEGELLVLEAPLSFWGGMDAATGIVIDRHHPQCGVALSGKIVAMPEGRGSSSSSSVLAEAIRAGTAPSGLILSRPDGIVALGAIVAAELYDRHCPVIWLACDAYAMLRSGLRVRLSAGDEHATVEHPATIR
jgi:predicted aconitase with swiveling domain